MNKLSQFWENLRESFWFVPACLVLGAILLATGLIEADRASEVDLAAKFPRAFAISAEGATSILSSIATSVITVAGVTFSITMLILAEAANQYSPRILRNFIRDRSNQFVLGAFLSIFTYCLVVLRSIHDVEGERFVPLMAVLAGVILAILSIGVLIFFIHHVAYSIQASSIIERIGRETLHAIHLLFPHEMGAGSDEQPFILPRDLADENQWHPVKATRSGYLEIVEADALLTEAERQDTIVRMEYGIGDFVIEDTPLFSLYHREANQEKETKKLRDTFIINVHRTIEQDAAFGIRQLVDIALKALSPSMNDTTTANMCLDRLTVILACVIQRKIESPCRLKNGKLRVITRRPTFEGFLKSALEQIRQNSRGNIRMLHQLLYVVRTLTPLTSSPTRWQALQEQAELIRETIETSVPSESDKADLLRECNDVSKRLLDQLALSR